MYYSDLLYTCIYTHSVNYCLFFDEKCYNVIPIFVSTRLPL